MDKKKDSHSKPKSDRERNSVLLHLLGKLGLKGIKGKLSIGITAFVAISSTVACGAIYLGVSGVVESNEPLRRMAIVAAALLVFLTIGIVSLVFARALAIHIEQMSRAIERVKAGDLETRVSLATGDDLEWMAENFNEMVAEISGRLDRHDEEISLLAVSEAEWKALFDHSPAPQWIHDRETGRFLAINKAACDQYGYTKVELDDLVVSDLNYAKMISEETKHVKQDGTIIEVEITGCDLVFAGKQARLVQALDVTERKRKETAQAALHRIVERRNTAQDLQGFYAAIHNIIGQIMYSKNFFIALYDANSQEVSFPYFVDEFDSPPEPRKMRKGFTEYVIRTGNALLARREDLKDLLRRGEVEQIGEPPSCWLGIPLKSRDKTVGALVVQSYRDDVSFGPEDEEVLMFVSQHIATAVDRKRAEEALEGSLADFLAVASQVSEGDLTRRGTEGEDALGRAIQSVNKMLDDFSLMLTEVKQIGLSVSSSATEILAAAEQIAVGSQRQADEITNTSSAVEEMAASMTQVSRNADASAEAARRALEMAGQGDQAVRDTTDAMGRIDSAVQQTAEKMRLLGLRSTEISEILDLINDIASQTNLLALNAAIEAAHAGDAGLGFSVVAEEIRKLAERSGRATKDIGNLIKSIQKETLEALAAMENGMKEVEGGSTLAGRASRALNDISLAVRESSELIEEISAASDEQAKVTRNLAGAMQTISTITLETTAGAHETAQTIQGMVSLSEQLNSAISQFKVKDDFVHPFSYDLQRAASRRMRNDYRSREFQQAD
ncbi:MAG TPA: methyl-accepting chemotaxis protein [Blastocatellia bacterium]|nr:methyl-accepting chemotaxis protein [Blastocatellia bacterium]